MKQEEKPGNEKKNIPLTRGWEREREIYRILMKIHLKWMKIYNRNIRHIKKYNYIKHRKI